MKALLPIIAIFVLAFVLRFYLLTSIPPSLSWDEVSFGYNAWSILQTGKDEYGTPYPFLFRAFDEYKQPGLVYLTAVSEAIFGLNAFAVRFPVALSGLGIVLFCYLLGKKLISYHFGLLFAFLSAINPWLINFSRQGFESTVSLFFVTAGIYYLLSWKDRPRNLIISAALFAISMYFYHATRIVTPFILVAFAVFYRKELFKQKRETVTAFIVGLVLLIPLFQHSLSSQGLSRINQVLVTDDIIYIQKQEQYAAQILQSNNSLVSRILYNRRRAFVESVAINYFRNINPSHVFFTGTISAGLLYAWELPFFIAGIYWLLKQKKQWKWIVLVWLLAYPLSGAFTKDQPNSLRTLIGAPVLIMISSLGVWWVYGQLKNSRYKLIFKGTVGLAIVYFVYTFLVNYFITAPETRAVDFGDGHKQLALYLQSKQVNYDTIWVTGDYWRPYIHVLFHMSYDPASYHANGTKEGFFKYKFGKADWDTNGVDVDKILLEDFRNAKPDTKTLYILSKKEYEYITSQNITIKTVEQINGLYAENVFYAVTL